jgi:hypothetical protein
VFFRKKPAPVDPIETRLAVASATIERSRVAIQQNYARRNFEYVTRNSDAALRGHLERVALLHRVKKDLTAAKAELATAAPFLDTIEDAIAKCAAQGVSDTNFIHVINFTHAFVLMFVAGDWNRAERLALAAGAAVIIEEGGEAESGGIASQIPRLIIATVLDDRAGFERVAARFRTDTDRKELRLDRRYFHYHELMRAILERNGEHFGTLLSARDGSFRSREREKDVGGWLLYGYGDRNAMVFDVWSVALANLARHKGLTVSFDSEIVPTMDFAP